METKTPLLLVVLVTAHHLEDAIQLTVGVWWEELMVTADSNVDSNASDV